ncbi:hypothetical protein F441_12720 [Phytophthora nicotianae CJ01A1]|uniref:Uncharacterized protein n=1 Tax=Phytophthora nicotianae CJ01A1 TaxID=1317063 RepID=W2WMS2_PHYNI|nr:hypothetical protein F441_12720 [Phytophthora nicotianae CJ01A1]
MTFASTTTTTLNTTFLSIQLIMQSIMRHNGGNALRLSHIQKDKLLRAGELPDSLSCDPALFRATLAKVVPQRATCPLNHLGLRPLLLTLLVLEYIDLCALFIRV